MRRQSHLSQKEMALKQVFQLQVHAAGVIQEQQQNLEQRAKYLKMSREHDLMDLETKHNDEVAKLEA